jgi:hypothetical protein
MWTVDFDHWTVEIILAFGVRKVEEVESLISSITNSRYAKPGQPSGQGRITAVDLLGSGIPTFQYFGVRHTRNTDDKEKETVK